MTLVTFLKSYFCYRVIRARKQKCMLAELSFALECEFMVGKHTKKEQPSLFFVLLIIVILIAGVAIVLFISQRNPSNLVRDGSASSQDGPDEEAYQLTDSTQSSSVLGINDETSASEYVTISTEFGNLYYPEQWSDYLETSQEWENDSLVISFSAKIREVEFPMFQVTIGNSEDALVGELTDSSGTKRNVYMYVVEIEPSEELSEEEQQRVYAMQEDLNYLIDHLA